MSNTDHRSICFFSGITGLDLRKALKLLRKSNPPPLLEWLSSPIIYKEAKAPLLPKDGKSFARGNDGVVAADGVVESSGDSTNQTKKISPNARQMNILER